jgi:hypothetical protein
MTGEGLFTLLAIYKSVGKGKPYSDWSWNIGGSGSLAIE